MLAWVYAIIPLSILIWKFTFDWQKDLNSIRSIDLYAIMQLCSIEDWENIEFISAFVFQGSENNCVHIQEKKSVALQILGKPVEGEKQVWNSIQKV